jgi:hypothetical protein
MRDKTSREEAVREERTREKWSARPGMRELSEEVKQLQAKTNERYGYWGSERKI